RNQSGGNPDLAIARSLSLLVCIRAAWLCLAGWGHIADLVWRVLRGSESIPQRLKAMAHTFMGSCYAAQMRTREIDHIHVHHGYFGAWVGLVASRLLGAGFSMTLHGSDLLLHGTYLDTKLAGCKFCLTVSEYNRRFILQRYPELDARRVLVARLGADL